MFLQSMRQAAEIENFIMCYDFVILSLTLFRYLLRNSARLLIACFTHEDPLSVLQVQDNFDDVSHHNLSTLAKRLLHIAAKHEIILRKRDGQMYLVVVVSGNFWEDLIDPVKTAEGEAVEGWPKLKVKVGTQPQTVTNAVIC